MKPLVQWLVARLGRDMNWWVDETSEDVYWGTDAISLLDPRQVAYLRETLAEYAPYGFNPRSLARAFHLFEASSELSDGRLKLVPSAHSIMEEDVPLFAVPDLIQDEGGFYPEFLDQVAALRIQLLNATHVYFQALDELDMEEDIQARNAGRYFEGRAIHVFNELEDILTWKPAEWDEEEEGRPERRAARAENEEDESEEEQA